MALNSYCWEEHYLLIGVLSGGETYLVLSDGAEQDEVVEFCIKKWGAFSFGSITTLTEDSYDTLKDSHCYYLIEGEH